MTNYKLYIEESSKLRIIEPPESILRYGGTYIIEVLYFSNEIENQEKPMHYLLRTNLDILVLQLSNIKYD